MKPFPLGLLFLAGLLAVSCATAQSRTKALRQLVQQYSAAGQFNGSVLVADAGGVWLRESTGYAQHEWQQPNTARTRFRIASVSKSFTAVMVMQQVERGRIRLDAPVSDYLPEYPADKGQRITVRHLLSHRSGIVHYFPDFYTRYSRNPYSPTELMALFWDLPLLFEPGTDFRYSSFGYVVLGVILERVTGQSYAQLLAEQICKPAGLTDTGVDDDMAVVPGRAEGYFVAGPRVRCSFRHMTTVFGTGQLYSTTEDLYRWQQALTGDLLLSAASRALLFGPSPQGYGYGWACGAYPVSPQLSVPAVWHTGGYNGFNCIVLRDTARGFQVIVLANDEPSDVEGLAKGLLALLYGEAPAAPAQAAGAELAAAWDRQGLAGAKEVYARMRAAGDRYALSEGTLIGLSEYYGMRRQQQTVIALLEWNIELYPNSSWSYSNLATVYAEAGNEELAVRYYEKTLELFPHDSVAKTYLARIRSRRP